MMREEMYVPHLAPPPSPPSLDLADPLIPLSVVVPATKYDVTQYSFFFRTFQTLKIYHNEHSICVAES
jgi:hypothetical protein